MHLRSSYISGLWQFYLRAQFRDRLAHRLALGDAISVGTLIVDGVQFPTLTITRKVAADDIRVTPETSPDLITWNSGADAIVLANTFHNGDGTATFTWRSTRPFAPDQPREFLRFQIESLQNP